jgi:transcriptional regulator with GAF, ATPase, and Fis domain
VKDAAVSGSRSVTSGEEGVSTLRVGADEILYRSASMRSVMATVNLIAQSDVSVLLLGESGSGKEVIARAIHELSARSEGMFVPINCASLSGDILENELFGHERGAFTSADEQKRGLFELADGGTVLLDEINEMGLHVQPKLLRVLERREFRRVGGTKKIKVDLRIIAASNVDLDAEVRMRRFRCATDARTSPSSPGTSSADCARTTGGRRTSRSAPWAACATTRGPETSGS